MELEELGQRVRGRNGVGGRKREGERIRTLLYKVYDKSQKIRASIRVSTVAVSRSICSFDHCIVVVLFYMQLYEPIW